MKKCGIYCIKNLINGKIYIGQSGDMFRRKIVHFSELSRGCHRNQHLQAAFNQYGKNNFEFRVLEEIPENMLDVREKAWIEFNHSINPKFGYNLEDGGNENKHPSSETIRKNSQAHIGHVHTLETRKKIGIASRGNLYGLGYRHTNEAIAKIRAAQIGRLRSLETRVKMSTEKLGHIVTPETCRKLREAWIIRKAHSKPAIYSSCLEIQPQLN